MTEIILYKPCPARRDGGMCVWVKIRTTDPRHGYAVDQCRVCGSLR